MIAYIFINILFIYQMFLKTIVEFLQIYQKNMTRVLDHLFYAEFKEYSQPETKKKFSFKKKKKTKDKIKAPIICQYFRSMAGLVWLYPAAIAEAWFSLFLGCQCHTDSNKKLK